MVQEGIMCGTPVLLTSQVGASELFQGPARQLILEERTAATLGEKIQQLLGHKVRREEAHTAVYDLMKFNTDRANFEKTVAFLELIPGKSL